MAEINKLIGYTEIKFLDDLIPIKIGMRSLELFCAAYDVPISRVALEVFEDFEMPDGRKSFKPKELSKFLTIALWAGANYASKVIGGRDYEIIEAYQWVDEIGIDSKESIKIISEFYLSIMNGGPLPKASEVPKSAKPKTETKKKR